MKIILVDDEIDILEDLSFALKPTRYQIFTETNPLKAIERYKNEGFDVVISDIRMPELNGIDLLKTIREYDKKARVIIITAYGDLETAKAAINNRAYAFFGKPVNIAELIEFLKTIEEEIKGAQAEIDYKNLQSEFVKLKETYSHLLATLKNNRG